VSLLLCLNHCRHHKPNPHPRRSRVSKNPPLPPASQMTGEMVAMRPNARKKTASKKGSLGLASDMKLPMATASWCGADLLALHLVPGDVITVKSRRGEVVIHARRDDGRPQGAVFIRGRSEPDDPCRAGPVRKNPGVQILRRGHSRWRRSCRGGRLCPGSAHAPSTFSQVESE